jgi:PLP dependent protein
MGMIYDNLQTVRAQISAACSECGRNPNEVALLAVSKTMPAGAVRQAYEAGQREFGENYIAEGVDKIAQLADLPGAVWHMIGPIQSNKTRDVAAHFDWVHSIDRLKIAQRLAEQRPAHLPPLNVCIQVNIDGGLNKSGVAPEESLALALAVRSLPRLALRGLMAIPEPTTDSVANSLVLASVKSLFLKLKAHCEELDTLSMGMSADMKQAIAQGSTVVRVGTAIFGQRSAKP